MSEKNSDKNLLSNKVLHYLKEQIFLGFYSAGDHISEPKIAKELDVSRAPVRVAINTLEKQGLIKSIPRRGSFVVEFDEQDIEEIYDIRIMLEGKILKILIEERLLTTQDYKNLEKLAEKMLEISRLDKSLEEKIIPFMKNDIDFHKYLWEKSGRKLSYRVLQNNYFQMQLAMIHDYKKDTNLEKTVIHHFNILKYLKENNFKRCYGALIDHIVDYNKKIKNFI